MPTIDTYFNVPSISFAIGVSNVVEAAGTSTGSATTSFILTADNIFPLDAASIASATVTGIGNRIVTEDVQDIFDAENRFIATTLIPTITDVLNFSEAVEINRPISVESAFTIQDTRESINVSTLVSDSFYTGNEVYMSVLLALQDTLTITEANNFLLSAFLTEIIDISEAVVPSNLSRLTVTDVFETSDSALLGLSEAIADSINVTATIGDIRTQLEVLSEVFTIQSISEISTQKLESLIDTFNISESVNFEGSIYTVFLVDTAEFGDVLWSPDFGAVAWLMNTEGESISPLLNFDFRTIAEHNGKVIAASSQGIYEITGDDDAGRKIDAYVKYGFDDFGSPNRKRASDLYMSYTGGGLESSIETYDGPKTVYNYPIEIRGAEAPRNNRMKVGRGLVSRYWRTEVHNQEGAAFKVYELGLNISTSKRRL